MKLCIIPPVGNLSLSYHGDAFFTLADLALQNDRYTMFFRNLKDQLVIMDNGAYELGHPLLHDDLLQAGREMKVNEIVLPDIPLKQAETVQATYLFWQSLSDDEKKEFKWMFVPQGTNPFEMKQTYDKIIGLDIHPNTVGMSILWDKSTLFKRRDAWRGFAAIDGLDIHLLGLDDPAELLCYNKRIRSVDCSLPISLAVNGQDIEFCNQPHPRVSLNTQLSLANQIRSERNIFALRALARYVGGL
jgi:hypothetical protein